MVEKIRERVMKNTKNEMILRPHPVKAETPKANPKAPAKNRSLK